MSRTASTDIGHAITLTAIMTSFTNDSHWAGVVMHLNHVSGNIDQLVTAVQAEGQKNLLQSAVNDALTVR